MARKPARKAKGRKEAARRKPSGTAGRTRRRASASRRSSAGTRTRRGKAAATKRAKPARKVAKKTAKPRRSQAAKAGAKAGSKRPSREAATVARRAPSLERERKQLRELDEGIPGPPSSLNMDRHGSAARTGRAELKRARQEHTETSPAMTGGDVDADWEDAYAVGDEAPGGDNPTPDQDRVDDIGRALGVEYQDNEELKGSDKISSRDKHRWELDPASSEDYTDRD
jgi:hypothetical protein